MEIGERGSRYFLPHGEGVVPGFWVGSRGLWADFTPRRRLRGTSWERLCLARIFVPGRLAPVRASRPPWPLPRLQIRHSRESGNPCVLGTRASRPHGGEAPENRMRAGRPRSQEARVLREAVRAQERRRVSEAHERCAAAHAVAADRGGPRRMLWERRVLRRRASRPPSSFPRKRESRRPGNAAERAARTARLGTAPWERGRLARKRTTVDPQPPNAGGTPAFPGGPHLPTRRSQDARSPHCTCLFHYPGRGSRRKGRCGSRAAASAARRWFWMDSRIERSSEPRSASSSTACARRAKSSWRPRPRRSR